MFTEFAYVYVAIESGTQLLLKGLHICRIHLHVYRNCICVCCYSNRYAVSLERVHICRTHLHVYRICLCLQSPFNSNCIFLQCYHMLPELSLKSRLPNLIEAARTFGMQMYPQIGFNKTNVPPGNGLSNVHHKFRDYKILENNPSTTSSVHTLPDLPGDLTEYPECERFFDGRPMLSE
jgi:hypothetical protein